MEVEGTRCYSVFTISVFIRAGVVMICNTSVVLTSSLNSVSPCGLHVSCLENRDHERCCPRNELFRRIEM